MRIWSDNLQLPCVQPPNSLCATSNFLVYNLQLPHITSNFLMVAIVIMVATVMVVMLVMVVVVNMVVIVVRTVQYSTVRDGTGRDGTGQQRQQRR